MEHAAGAGRGNRTPTISLPPDFESGASTSSAIPAGQRGLNGKPIASSVRTRAIKTAASAFVWRELTGNANGFIRSNSHAWNGSIAVRFQTGLSRKRQHATRNATFRVERREAGQVLVNAGDREVVKWKTPLPSVSRSHAFAPLRLHLLTPRASRLTHHSSPITHSPFPITVYRSPFTVYHPPATRSR